MKKPQNKITGPATLKFSNGQEIKGSAEISWYSTAHPKPSAAMLCAVADRFTELQIAQSTVSDALLAMFMKQSWVMVSCDRAICYGKLKAGNEPSCIMCAPTITLREALALCRAC